MSGVDHRVQRFGRVVRLDATENEPGNFLADDVAGRPDRGQRRQAVRAEAKVAESDHGQIAGHGDIAPLALEQDAEGDQVVGAGDGGKVGLLAQGARQEQGPRLGARRRRIVEEGGGCAIGAEIAAMKPAARCAARRSS